MRWALAGIVLALAATALGALLFAARDSPRVGASGPPQGPYRGSTPPAGIRAPDFVLRSYRGSLVSMRDQRGKVVLLSFVDTQCTEKCPIVTSVMAAAYRLLTPGERRQVVPLLVTVEPRSDTPARVRRFLATRNALAVDYLVGSVPLLRPVWRAYGVLPAVDTGNADVHSSGLRVFDREGVWVTTQHAGVELTAPNLAHDTREALRRSS